MSEPCTIVRLHRQDAAAAASIDTQVFAEAWNETMLRGEIDHPAARCYGAIVPPDGMLAGYVCVMVAADECCVHRVATRPTLRRRGIAGRLLQHALATARAEGCMQATLEVSSANAPARALYERLGFRVAGMRAGYYRREGSDALIMRTSLAGQEFDRQ